MSHERIISFLPSDGQQPSRECEVADIVEASRVVFREEAKRLLDEYAALKPLMAIGDLARSLSVSVRTTETWLAAGDLPAPLWIGGQRRWHPDAIDAYLRSLEGKARRRACR